MATNHPSQGHQYRYSVGQVNPDEFLDKLKPKAPALMSQQAIFDAAIRVMYRQGGPCIKVDDKGTKTITTFSTRKGGFFVSPILSLLTPEDIRRLQKATSYERLQTMKIWGLSQTSVQAKEDQEIVKVYLGERGVGVTNWAYMQALETKHFEWGGKCLTVDDYEKERGHIMAHLYATMVDFTRAFHLNADVLNLFRPA